MALLEVAGTRGLCEPWTRKGYPVRTLDKSRRIGLGSHCSSFTGVTGRLKSNFRGNLYVKARSSTFLRASQVAVSEEPTAHPPQLKGKDGPKFKRRALLTLTAATLFSTAMLNESLAHAAEATDKGAETGKKDVAGGAGKEGVAKPADVSRVYDATVLGEPMRLGTKETVYKKLAKSRVVYLGEAERAPDLDDQALELEIVSMLRDLYFEQKRPVSLALQSFPKPMQRILDTYMNKKMTDVEMRQATQYTLGPRIEQYLPLLRYCRDYGVRLVAIGVPPEVLRKVQANGVAGLTPEERKMYAPPRGGGLPLSIDTSAVRVQTELPGEKGLAPGLYRFAEARAVTDFTMAAAIAEAMAVQGTVGLVIAVTGASHVAYGARGRGVPARIAGKLKRQGQTVVLLNPERQLSRAEGDVPEADFLWYSNAKACLRNCFDRAEVAHVMGAAGRTREKLPQDLQYGLEQGLISPETLRSFFELDKQPVVAYLAERFQGLRERWLADPRFLQRLGVEEAISITTTLIAEYQKRGKNFWAEIEYVITDVTRGAVVDFFTVWLPAPTLSFRGLEPTPIQGAGGWWAILGSLPDNAFQRAPPGKHWGLSERALSVVVGGAKLFGVGAVANLGTLSIVNGVRRFQERLQPVAGLKNSTKRSPVFKTALVYASFLATSSNLRYQAIAGLVEHWGADYLLADWPLLGSALSFTARTANSFWGTQQWIDLARFTGLQAHKETPEPGISSEEKGVALPPPSLPPQDSNRDDTVESTLTPPALGAAPLTVNSELEPSSRSDSNCDS